MGPDGHRRLLGITIGADEHAGLGAAVRRVLPEAARQYEFARLNLDYTVVSKRRLEKLVVERLFSELTEKQLRRLAVTSVPELISV